MKHQFLIGGSDNNGIIIIISLNRTKMNHRLTLTS